MNPIKEMTMKRKLIGLAAASMLLCSALALAQSSAGPARSAVEGDSTKSFTHGESKRCATLSGDAKVLCDKEEATKAQGSAAEQASSGSSAAAGGSAQPKASASSGTGAGTQSWSNDSPQPGSTPSGITPD
jgi:hypothetical protein